MGLIHSLDIDFRQVSELVKKSQTTLILDRQTVVHNNDYIIMCKSLVGGIMLATYTDPKCMVVKGVGRHLCPLFGILRVCFSCVLNVLFLWYFQSILGT